jgi:N-acetylglucosamine-6-phosphate deacetylase
MVEFAAFMKERGVHLSIGHSDADSECAHRAFEMGFTHVTHLYSCTSSVHRRNCARYAGIVEEAYLNDEMTVEIIADGVHLPKDLLRLVYKLKGADRICMVTDAIRASGLPNGAKTKIGSLKRGLDVIVEDDVAKLPDRQAFAGSTATTDRLFRTMAEAIGKDDAHIVDIAKMASTTPAAVMGLADRGEIKAGKLADLVILDADLQLVTVITDKQN